MGKTKLVMVLVASLLIAVSVPQIIPAVGSGAQGVSGNPRFVAAGPTIFVEPSLLTVFENGIFIVNVGLYDVVDLAGWQFNLYWDRTMLFCVNATVNTPVEGRGVALDLFNKTEADVNLDAGHEAWEFGPGIDNDYSDTYGLYSKAECLPPKGSAYHQSFNGSMSLVTLTFRATRFGITALTLANTLVANSAALPIDHTVLSGPKALLVPGKTEAPTTRDEPARDNGQNGLGPFIITPSSETAFGEMPANWTIAMHHPIVVCPVNWTVTSAPLEGSNP